MTAAGGGVYSGNLPRCTLDPAFCIRLNAITGPALRFCPNSDNQETELERADAYSQHSDIPTTDILVNQHMPDWYVTGYLVQTDSKKPTAR